MDGDFASHAKKCGPMFRDARLLPEKSPKTLGNGAKTMRLPQHSLALSHKVA
jgi:hypothetical protein